MIVTVIPERYKRQKPAGDTVTGKPVTYSAIVALDTSTIVEHRKRKAEIPLLTEEQRQKTPKTVWEVPL
jgi:hypothetical protein